LGGGGEYVNMFGLPEFHCITMKAMEVLNLVEASIEIVCHPVIRPIA
jgi:hypothetical protein